MQALVRRGFAAEVLCGTVLDLYQETDPVAWPTGHGLKFETIGGGTQTAAIGVQCEKPVHFRLTIGGVPVTVHRSPTTRPHVAGDSERREFLHLYADALDRFHPDILVTYGGSRLNREVLALSKARGIATVFVVHSLDYRSADPFADVDAVLVPSRFAADYYHRTLGLRCTVLPNLIDFDRVRTRRNQPQFVTFVNPSPEKGAFPFARIADELGRRRSDIRLLVVEGRGTEKTLADCGLDLRVQGNVHLMAHTHDPRQFWRVSRLCLMPSLWWENQPLVAIEAMVNGIPVIGSDRGGIPEALGDSGVVLPLPARLTPTAHMLPTSEEVAPWVEAIIRLWDDALLYEEHRQKAFAQARRWAPEVLEPRYVQFFDELRPRPVSPL
jgi:glycosyltransferase involved in cell wall biosynthesis